MIGASVETGAPFVYAAKEGVVNMPGYITMGADDPGRLKVDAPLAPPSGFGGNWLFRIGAP